MLRQGQIADHKNSIKLIRNFSNGARVQNYAARAFRAGASGSNELRNIQTLTRMLIRLMQRIHRTTQGDERKMRQQ
jgi:hypothetical protein